jgi:hypothetical protein
VFGGSLGAFFAALAALAFGAADDGPVAAAPQERPVLVRRVVTRVVVHHDAPVRRPPHPAAVRPAEPPAAAPAPAPAPLTTQSS